jgi:hypothetical protein
VGDAEADLARSQERVRELMVALRDMELWRDDLRDELTLTRAAHGCEPGEHKPGTHDAEWERKVLAGGTPP